MKMEDLDHDVLKTQVVEHLKDAWRFTDAPDLEYIKDQALDFCKNQEIKKAILSSDYCNYKSLKLDLLILRIKIKILLSLKFVIDK